MFASRRFLVATALVAAVAATIPATAQAQGAIAKFVDGMERKDGFVPLYWSPTKGKLYVEIARFGEEFLYLTSLATGIGIAGLDLDRGMLSDEYLARFERLGNRAILNLQHPRFRSTNPSPPHQRSVQESFPTSAVAGMEIVAEEGGRVLADITPYVITDVVNVRGELRASNEGSYSIDRERSGVYPERTRAFPNNTEIEATITLTSDQPGTRVRGHTPDARAITIRQHHSFVKLPEPGYRTRRFDPRVGVNGISYYDFARGFEDDYVVRLAARHRLQKKDPRAAISEPVKPIVFYLDAGIQEPYRTAFRQGIMWWNTAFEAAGYRNAIRVDDMPADMDPMDARYHVVQWIHRSQPSSSWGNSFVDPRTGEIIKAAVRMDSHRSIVDHNIFAGAAPGFAMPADDLEESWLASLDTTVDAQEFAMARRRQHAAHEVGHVLGFAHNFIASAYGGRASALAYPAPLIKLTNGRIDLRDAYREGLGAYDTIAVRYAYTEFDPAVENDSLDAIILEADRKGIRFLTNPDEGIGSSYPEGTTWVNGEDAVEELDRVLSVRRVLITEFDENAIRRGQPWSMMNRRFVSVYLHHRYTLDAAIKAVGGMQYRYGVRGDSVPATEIIGPERQRRALGLVLRSIQPIELAIPEATLRLMAPRGFGGDTDQREFRSSAAPAFDQLGVARTLATMAVRGLLHPNRVARLAAFNARDARNPGVAEVIDLMVGRTWGGPPVAARERALRRVSERVVLDELARLALDNTATVEGRAGAEYGLRQIASTIRARGMGIGDDAAHRQLALADIDRVLTRRDAATPRTEPAAAPPGSPIGQPVP